MFGLRGVVGGLFKRTFSAAGEAAAAQVYFESVLSRYLGARGLPGAPVDPAAVEAAEKLVAKRRESPASITMNDAFLLERMTCRLLPPDRLADILDEERAHYKRLASPEDFKTFLESRPVAPASPPDEARTRAEIGELLDLIQDVYIFEPFREEIRGRLTLRITFLLFLLLAVVLIVAWVRGRDQPFPTLLTAMFVGGLGGLVSVHYRIQSMPRGEDAIRGALALYNGWFSVYFSPAVGAVSAGLLYMLFRGTLISGTLFPTFGDAQGSATPGDAGFYALVGLSEGLAAREYAKLVIWSFVAGFVERVVPNTLSRLGDVLAAQKFPGEPIPAVPTGVGRESKPVEGAAGKPSEPIPSVVLVARDPGGDSDGRDGAKLGEAARPRP